MGKLEKKAVFSPCCGDEATTYYDRAKRKSSHRLKHPATFQGKASRPDWVKDETQQTHSSIGIIPALRPADDDGRVP